MGASCRSDRGCPDFELGWEGLGPPNVCSLTTGQAEVQAVFSDGAVSLHTRSLKYGKVSGCGLFRSLCPMPLAPSRAGAG